MIIKDRYIIRYAYIVNMVKKEKIVGLAGLNALKKSLKDCGVTIAYMFGSQLTKETTPLSDIDIGIVLNDPSVKNNDPAGIYTSLLDAFKKYLNDPKRKIDIVYLTETSFHFQMNVIRTGVVLYSSSKKIREDYEDYVMMRGLDWNYFEETFNKEMVEAL